MSQDFNIVADVGGTNMRVAQTRGAAILSNTVKRYRNSDHASLEAVLRTYLAEMKIDKSDGTCVAVAGPVRDGIGKLTNLDWQIDVDTLKSTTGTAKVDILNDLQAQGHALPSIKSSSLIPVKTETIAPSMDARMVVNAGTGFNIAVAFHNGNRWFVPPSEAGHTTLPMRSRGDVDLGWAIAEAPGCPSVEDALSGRGIERLYRWVTGQSHGLKGAEIVALFESGDVQATETAELYARLLGEVVANLALSILPTGGIFLSGGVNKALGPHLNKLGFLESFHDKGRFADFMEQFSIHVITDDNVPLAGCAAHLNAL